MKLKKRTAMIVSFAVGILLFGTTALAEIATKNGYEQMKDAIKNTSSSLTTKASSYTTEMNAILKIDGKTSYSQETISKQDIKNDMYESTNTIVRGSDKTTDYSYKDKNGSINYNGKSDIYYVSEYPNPANPSTQKDPFEEKEAEDIERIIDAFVGNLREYVVVSQRSDGSKELSGSLSEAQIPALVNAISSYALKQQLGSRYRASADYMSIPQITKDVYVKEVRGTMEVDKDGVIKTVLGTAVVYGKDEEGKEHTLSFEALGKVTGINSTSVKKPDLKGKKIEKINNPKENGLSNVEMYIGTYKNNIVIEKDGRFIKIGERVLTISQMSSETVSGSYKETYIKDYENYQGRIKDFDFSGKIEKMGYSASFTLPEGSSLKGTGQLHFMPSRPKISFYPGNIGGQFIYDGEFDRVFE